MRDDIIDANSITLPLISFSNPPAPPRANATSPASSATATGTGPALGTAEDDDDDDDKVGDDLFHIEDVVINGVSQGPVTKAGNKPSGSRWIHPELVRPHVIARTQLRVIDSSAQYNLKDFNKRHIYHKEHACTAADSKWRLSKLAHENCRTRWDQVGPFRLRVKLARDMNESTGQQRQIQRAYAPSMTINDKVGPQDLVKIPVNRTAIVKNEEGVYTPLATYNECTRQYASTTQLDFCQADQLLVLAGNLTAIDIAWRISLSGRTPAKSWLADKLINLSPVNVAHNATDLNRALQQDTHAVFDGLAGHRHHPGSHPRRRAAVWFVQTVLAVLFWFGSLFYWFSLQSTVGLATRAWCVLGATPVLREVATLTRDLMNDGLPPEALLGVVFILPVCLLPDFFVLRAASRLEVSWTGPNGRRRSIPRLRRRTASHLERASDRIEASLSLRNILSVGTVILLLYGAFPANDTYLVRSSLPASSLHDRGKTWKSDRAISAISNALIMTARGVQLAVNHQRKRWAGNAKWVAKGQAVSQVLGVLGLTRLVTGEWEHFSGFSVDAGLELCLALAEGAQAWLYEGGEDGEVEEEK